MTTAVVACLWPCATASADPAPPTPLLAPPPGLSPSGAYVLVDVDTGRVLDQSNDRQALPPASLTKIMTALVATAYLPADAQIPISARDATVEPDRVGMKAGEVWPLDQAMQALLIVSGNDAAYALAEKVGGTAENFAPMLDYASGELKLADNPVWADPAGLDDSHAIGQGNLVSARDLAIASRALLAQPQLAQIVAEDALQITGPQGTVYNLQSHNLAFLKAYPGAIGVKTGYTDKAGICLAAAATREGRTMLVVALHGMNPDQTAEMLLDQGFATPVGAEPAADVLPAVVIPQPPDLTAHAPAVTATSGARRNAKRLAAGRPGASRFGPRTSAAALTTANRWLAVSSAMILMVVGLVATRLAGTRRRPLAHSRSV